MCTVYKPADAGAPSIVNALDAGHSILTEDLVRVATFMGYTSAGEFASDLLHHLRQVRAHYAEVFELVPELLTPAALGLELDFSGVDAAPEATTTALRTMGFENPQRIVTGTVTLAATLPFPPDTEVVVRVVDVTPLERPRQCPGTTSPL